jgi:hypothetical protein
MSLIATPDVILDAASCVIGRRLLVAARDHLPARRCWAVHDRLILDGVLGDDIARLLECAYKKAALFGLSWAPFAGTGQRT